jgi:hypothetical protein
MITHTAFILNEISESVVELVCQRTSTTSTG